MLIEEIIEEIKCTENFPEQSWVEVQRIVEATELIGEDDIEKIDIFVSRTVDIYDRLVKSIIYEKTIPKAITKEQKNDIRKKFNVHYNVLKILTRISEEIDEIILFNGSLIETSE